MKIIFFYSCCCILSIAANAQKRSQIYLGPSSDSFFSYPITRAVAPEVSQRPLPAIAVYHAFSHCTIDSNKKESLNRIGLVLPAKSTTIYEKRSQASFGTGSDTCFIGYESAITVVTHGRSATLSIINLFSKEENKMPQEEPYDVVTNIFLKGTVIMKDSFFDFFLDCAQEKKYLPRGFIVFHNDTLRFERASKLIKKGRKKNANHAFQTGILLKKGETTYAAIDLYQGKKIVHVSTKLDYDDRIKILVCFFIIPLYTV